MKVKILQLPHAEGLKLPAYQSEHAAGMDLIAAQTAMLQPMGRGLIGTGLTIQIEPGFEAQIRPRSGLALKHGVTVLNTPGTIDADYRGEIKVLLINFGAEPFVVLRGERIAQLVFQRVERALLL